MVARQYTVRDVGHVQIAVRFVGDLPFQAPPTGAGKDVFIAAFLVVFQITRLCHVDDIFSGLIGVDDPVDLRLQDFRMLFRVKLRVGHDDDAEDLRMGRHWHCQRRAQEETCYRALEHCFFPTGLIFRSIHISRLSRKRPGSSGRPGSNTAFSADCCGTTRCRADSA